MIQNDGTAVSSLLATSIHRLIGLVCFGAEGFSAHIIQVYFVLSLEWSDTLLIYVCVHDIRLDAFLGTKLSFCVSNLASCRVGCVKPNDFFRHMIHTNRNHIVASKMVSF